MYKCIKNTGLQEQIYVVQRTKLKVSEEQVCIHPGVRWVPVITGKVTIDGPTSHPGGAVALMSLWSRRQYVLIHILQCMSVLNM
jgi:hypothetical protein